MKGYEVRVGRQRGFCPLMSQIDIVRTTDPIGARRSRLHRSIIEHKNDGKGPCRLAPAARGRAASTG